MSRINVMVVDDSALFRSILTAGLQEDPDIVIIESASSALDAWSKLLNVSPDVITLDIEMPGMRGIDFMHKFLPKIYIPTIVVSATESSRQNALDAGAMDFVAKVSNAANTQFFMDLRVKIKNAAASPRRAIPAAPRTDTARISAQTINKNTQTAKAPQSSPMSGLSPTMAALNAQHQAKAQSKLSAAQFTGSATATVIAAASKIAQSNTAQPAQPARDDSKNYKGNIELIAIGASTGGTEATSQILRNLTGDLPGIVITQHMPPVFTRLYSERLDGECPMHVKEAQTGDIIQKGWAYVAPGGLQMRINKQGGHFVISCEPGEKVSGHCPSVDVLFDSVAAAAGDKAMGVILTGMGADGSKGMLKMRKAGAYTIGQDQATCVVYGMPMEAYKLGAVVLQAPLDKIANSMLSRVRNKPV